MSTSTFDSLRLKGSLDIRHYRGPVLIHQEQSRQTITTVGKGWVVDKFQDILAATELLKWHKSGTGSTPAAAGDTDLQTGLYSRVAGSRTESAAAVYRSVATVSYTGSHTITEWGIFTTSSSGTLFARKTFSRAVISGDSIQFTWDLTVG